MLIHMKAVVLCALLFAAVALLFAEINLPAAGIDDFGSAVRGSLGISSEDLGLNHNLGELSLALNGGFALLSGAIACFAVVKRRREPMSGHDYWRSGDSAASI